MNKQIGVITIPPNKLDPDGSEYMLYKKNADISGSSEIPTCTVMFEDKGYAQHDGLCFYTKYENGVIVPVNIEKSSSVSGFEVTLENVVCGSIIYFNWTYTGDYGAANITGGAEQLPNGEQTMESPLFRAPLIPGEVCTIYLDGYENMIPI